jgi:hypothetical protein
VPESLKGDFTIEPVLNLKKLPFKVAVETVTIEL